MMNRGIHLIFLTVNRCCMLFILSSNRAQFYGRALGKKKHAYLKHKSKALLMQVMQRTTDI